MDAKRLLMWLSSQTQPRWKSGSCNAPCSALFSRSPSGISSLLNALSMSLVTQRVRDHATDRRYGTTTLAPTATCQAEEPPDLAPKIADQGDSADSPLAVPEREPVTTLYPNRVPFRNCLRCNGVPGLVGCPAVPYRMQAVADHQGVKGQG